MPLFTQSGRQVSHRMNAVELDSVSKRYGRIEALRSATLSIQPREVFGLLGPNGAGKTTLIRLLTGSTRPTSGSVRVLGVEPRLARSKIGYMPQAPALYEDLSPRENLAFFGGAHPIPKFSARVAELLAFSDLTARADDPVYQFSGGMKQRVSLACALLHRPQVLLLDEPTAGVELRLRAEFWSYFRESAAGGASLLITTHQMDEALFCDRLAILNAGAVIACDTPKNLLARGRAAVRVWRAGECSTVQVANYAETLPAMLHHYGLDPSITRIEVEHDSLETVVRGLIEHV
jgi:ABC-2 type transport system ATP-binding protein